MREESYEEDYLITKIILNDLKRINDLQLPFKCYCEEISSFLNTLKKQYIKNKCILSNELTKEEKILEINLSIGLEKIIYESTYKELIRINEEKILNRYKNNVMKEITKKLFNKTINFEEFCKKINEISNFKLNNDKAFKTINELDLNIKEKEYIKSNIFKLDKSIKGFALGELSVWSGGNASGKSTLLNQLILESINQNYNVAIYSGELTSQRLYNWLSLQASGMKELKNNNGYYRPTEKAEDKIKSWLDEKIYIYQNELGSKVKYVISVIREIIEKKNIKVIIIDNLMSLDNSEYNDKYEGQSLLVKELSSIVKEYNIHIHFVCHPRKAMNFLRKNDISGTADLTNIADNVFIVHRNNNDFKKATKEMFGLNEDNELYSYDNIIEICKNREYGIQDTFIGLFYEKETKRLLNTKDEYKHYNWENIGR